MVSVSSTRSHQRQRRVQIPLIQRKAISRLVSVISFLIVVGVPIYRYVLQQVDFIPPLPKTTVLLNNIGSTGNSAPRRRTPLHTACSDESVQGIYHIAMGDIGGAAGTIFFQFVVAQILYAERNGLKPWVHLSNVSHVVYDPLVHDSDKATTLTALVGRNATYIKRPGGHFRDRTPGPPNSSASVESSSLSFIGTGVWEHYFEPVSDYVPGDSSCENKLYVTMDLYLITPGLHGYADYTPKCWRYQYLPDYIAKPHLGLTEWLEPQRLIARRVVAAYLRPVAGIATVAQRVNPDCGTTNHVCLGLHIRHSDKASGRQIVPTEAFLPYVRAFMQTVAKITTGVMSVHIYLATDSSLVLDEIEQTWPESVRRVIRTADAGAAAGSTLMRSGSEVAVFDLHGATQHHRANLEVLTEIYALSACQFLVHGLSAVSEAAIWTGGMHLHDQSVNLEDPDRLNSTQFETLVRLVLAEKIGSSASSSRENWPRPVRSIDIWPDLYSPHYDSSKPKLGATGHACQGFDGVLLISSVGSSISGASAAFFTSVLNQLSFAEQHRLLPWVHLHGGLDGPNVNVFDDQIHASGRVEFEMVPGATFEQILLNGASKVHGYSSRVVLSANEEPPTPFVMKGNGIWNSYLEPVSDFVPGDASCRNLPLLELNETHITSDLLTHAPGSVRAWRYDNVLEDSWWQPSGETSLVDWYAPMRTLASQIVQKYYRFHPFLVQRAEQVIPVEPQQACLGMHLRNGDKMGRYREKIKPQMFEPYLEAFVQAGGRCIFLATDSHRALRYTLKTFPTRLTKHMRSQGEKVVRSSTRLEWPSHYLERHHRVNSEVLVDILALSRCQVLLHGFSTVSEAAIYLNPNLHLKSVNLEDPGRMSTVEFAAMATNIITSAT